MSLNVVASYEIMHPSEIDVILSCVTEGKFSNDESLSLFYYALTCRSLYRLVLLRTFVPGVLDILLLVLQHERDVS